MMNAPLSGALRDQIIRLLPSELASLFRAGQPSPELLARAIPLLRRRLTAMLPLVPTPIGRQQLLAPVPGVTRCERWHGSLLFADLSGFTALSEQLSALGREGSEVVTGVINQLFDALDEQVVHYGGSLLKFGGDALTAFFSADELGDQHAALATAAALAMQQRMAEIGLVETKQGSHILRLRIGIHSGTAFAAQLGDGEHMDLLLTGRDVNRVARAQDVAIPGEVVLTDETLRLLEGAYVVPRGAGFSALISYKPPGPRSLPPLPFPAERGDLDELVALARAIAALQIFLPQGFSATDLSADERISDGFRLVTVLFAHVAPLSELVERLPAPEAAAPLLNNYYWRMQHAVRQFGGSINKLDMASDGDKLLACFGAPVALENQQELALRAALEMQREAAEASQQIAAFGLPPLHQEIGINTGHVFAGLVGTSRRREYTVMGDVVNLAARLMAYAPAGAIWISPSTQRAVAHRFETQLLPPISLKGKARPVEPWALLGVSDQERPRQASLMAELPFVGREAEAARLLELAARALGGAGKTIVLSGEAGVGKSRMIEELLKSLKLASLDPAGLIAPFALMTSECQSYEQNIPFSAFGDLLLQILDMPRSGQKSRDQTFLLRQVETLAPELARFAPLLGDVLSVELQETAITESLSPQQRHDRTLDLIVALVAGLAARQPLVLHWDDLHWCDASSLEVLQRLMGEIASLPLLQIIGMRSEPGLAIDWDEQVFRLTLNELNLGSGAALVRELLRQEPPPELLERLRTTDEGYNPFFVTELLRTLVEAGVLLQQDGRWVIAGDLASLALPDTVEGVITARIDRLDLRQRETLQVASVIGRRFAYPILDAVVDEHAELPQRLAALSEADLILPAEDLTYLFKHMLTRDAVYASVLYARRRELHRRVAAKIEELYVDWLDEQTPLLARHYYDAEDWPRALHYAMAAGRRAQQHYHHREAIASFESALEIMAQLPQPSFEIGAEAHERMGHSLFQSGSYEESLAQMRRALAQLQTHRREDLLSQARIYRHMAAACEKTASYDDAFSSVEQGLALVAGSLSVERTQLLLMGAGLFQRQGRYAEARDWAREGLEIALACSSFADMAHGYTLLCGTYRNLGQQRLAIEMGQKSLALNLDHGNLGAQSDAHLNLANVYVDLGRHAESIHHYRAALELKQTIGDIYGQALVACNLGDAMRIMGDYVQAMQNFSSSLRQFEQLRSQYGAAVLHMNIGSVSLSQGNLDESQRHLEVARQMFEQIGAEDFLSELYRYSAELMLRRGDAPQALAYADQSLELAQRLSARAEEGSCQRIRASTLLALGRRDDAVEALQQARLILAEVENKPELASCLDQLAELSSGKDAAALRREAELLRSQVEAGQ